MKIFFQKNKIKILISTLIILIILIIFIILLFTVILKEKDSDEKKIQIIETQFINISEKIKTTEIINITDIITQETTIIPTYITDETEESNETCLEYNLTNSECLNCTKGYDLFKGICIKYAFNASYEYKYDFHPNKIFNPEKIKGLLAFKINNDEIMEPNSNNVINNFGNYTVYFYLNEKQFLFIYHICSMV